jgi:hypothetical protein
MRALLLSEYKKLSVVEMPVPAIAEDEVLIRVKAHHPPPQTPESADHASGSSRAAVDAASSCATMRSTS